MNLSSLNTPGCKTLSLDYCLSTTDGETKRCIDLPALEKSSSLLTVCLFGLLAKAITRYKPGILGGRRGHAHCCPGALGLAWALHTAAAHLSHCARTKEYLTIYEGLLTIWLPC